MNTKNLRWIQRFNNYKKALNKLVEAVSKIQEINNNESTGNKNQDPILIDIIKEGLIQRFEYTHELAWNVMKDFFENSGNTNIYGSKDATREAFANDIITNGDIWMDMIISRNKTSHTYNEVAADDIFFKINNEYLVEFLQFSKKMETLISSTNSYLL